jgi:hypothetical protein
VAKDFWRIESVDSVANMFVVQNLDGLADRLRAAGETFTITPDGAIAVEADDTVIQKCADGLYRALMFTPTGLATLTDNPNAVGPGITLRKGIPVDAQGNTFAATHARLTPHITGPSNPGPLGQAIPIVKSAGSGTPQVTDSRDLSAEVTARLVKLHNPERRGRNPSYRATQRI